MTPRTARVRPRLIFSRGSTCAFRRLFAAAGDRLYETRNGQKDDASAVGRKMARSGEWRRRDSITTQMTNFRDLSRSVAATFAPASKRTAARYTMHDDGPHHYIAALRPPGRITELGDQG